MDTFYQQVFIYEVTQSNMWANKFCIYDHSCPSDKKGSGKKLLEPEPLTTCTGCPKKVPGFDQQQKKSLTIEEKPNLYFETKNFEIR